MDNWPMFAKQKDEESKKPPIFKEYIIPIGTLLIAMLPFFAQSTLPWWESVAVVIYIAIVAVFLVAPVANRSWKNWRAKARQARFERKLFPEMIEIFRSFGPMVDSGRGNTLWGVWQDSGRTAETQKHIRPNQSHFQALSTWHGYLVKTGNSAKPSDFQFVTAEAASWVQQYIAFSRDAYYQFESLMRDRQLDETLLRQAKQSWNHVRDDNNKAISNWGALCEKINASFGQAVCSTYYETLKPLE